MDDIGAHLGWAIDPETRTVEINRPDRKAEVPTGVDSVAGEGPVEGLVLDLRKGLGSAGRLRVPRALPIQRLDRIEKKLDDHETRITRVEERTSPLARR